MSTDPVGAAWLHRIGWELDRLPKLLARVHCDRIPTSAADVTESHILLLRERLPWEKATFSVHFAALRPFLKWSHNPLVERGSVWRLPAGEPGRRRWLTRSQLVALFEGSRGPERVLVGLEGFNGLRRVECLRLRVKDVLFGEDSLRVLGKGRGGGKWRTIPLNPVLKATLAQSVAGKGTEERILPWSKSGADLLLRRAAERVGLPEHDVRVSHHDLRRTFGRVANAAGMNISQLAQLLGHASTDMTVRYIGLDRELMRSGLARFGRFVTRRDGRGS